MPAEIQPGEAIRFSFEFRAPAAGIRRENVSIFADGAEEPLAILRPVIRAKITPPKIIGIPAEYRVHLLRGQDFESELLVVSIENRGSPNLIQEVHIRPAGLLTARIAEVREQRSIDPDFVNRSYRLVISSVETAGEPTEQQVGLLWFTTDPGGDVGETQVELQIELRDPLAAIPARMKLTATGDGAVPTARLSLVRRTEGLPEVRIGEYDKTLVEVRRIPNDVPGELVYEIAAKSPVTSLVQTSVRFYLGDDDSCGIDIPVELVPSVLENSQD